MAGPPRPENTLAAFRHAIDLGADMIEAGVRSIRDEPLVLMHDPIAYFLVGQKGSG